MIAKKVPIYNNDCCLTKIVKPFLCHNDITLLIINISPLEDNKKDVKYSLDFGSNFLV
jgi:hypothetical protein